MEPMPTVERVCPVDLRVADPPVSGTRAAPSAGARIALGAACAAVLAAALAVDPSGLRPFTSLRWAVVSTSLALAGMACAWRAAPAGAVRPALPRWFVVAGVVVLASMVAAAALVGEPATAWLGHPQRHLGVLAWAVFATAAGCGAALAGEGREVLEVLRRAALAAALVTAIAAVADLAGWSPLGSSFAGGRIGGLLGQPTTLGALAVLLLPLAATGSADRRLRAAAVCGLLVAVLGSQTRGALVGLVAAGLVSLPALQRHARALVPAGVMAAALLVAVTPAGGRALAAGESGRADDWALAVTVLAEHPVLGVGPEGYRIAAVEALDDGYVARHGRDVVVDRAHSAPLDVAAAGGVAAGAAYVALVAGVAAATWRLQRRAPGSVAAAGGAGAVGLLAAGFVAFPSPELDAVAWLFAGLAVAAAGRPALPAQRRRVGAAAAALLLVVAAGAGVTDVLADRWLGDAQQLAGAGDTRAAVASADRATGLRPDLVDGWYVAARVAAAGPTVLDLDAAIERATEGRRRSPGDPALRVLHAELVTERALRTGLDVDRAAAVRTLGRALADDPTHPELHRLHRLLPDPGAAAR